MATRKQAKKKQVVKKVKTSTIETKKAKLKKRKMEIQRQIDKLEQELEDIIGAIRDCYMTKYRGK